MKTTDYARIAAVYDRNPGRHQQPVDGLVAQRLAARRREIRVLDLACGTGNYIRAQRKYYDGMPIRWHGLDKSKAMLAHARRRNPSVPLVIGTADRIPYRSGCFDLVSCNFAFHHFRYKRQALREIARVLKSGGYFALRDSCPEMMVADSWVYRFFPEALSIDRRRFWPADKLYAELLKCFHVREMETRIARGPQSYQQMIALATNRDLSNLSLVSDRGYADGLKRLRRASRNRRAYHASFATIRCVSVKA